MWQLATVPTRIRYVQDLSKRFYGACLDTSQEPALETGSFVERLLIFDSIVLRSAQLVEIEGLVQTFGSEGTTYLIESGVLAVHAEALSCGVRENSETSSGLDFVTVRAADRKASASGWLQRIISIPGLSYWEAKKLKSLVGTHLVYAPEEFGSEARQETRIDLEQRPALVRKALSVAIAEKLGASVDATDVQMSWNKGAGPYTWNSNLADVLGVTPEVERDIAKKVILGIGHLNEQVEWMKTFEAVTGFRNQEVSLYQQKLGALAPHPEAKVAEQLSRVVSLSGLPDLGAAARERKLHFDRVLEVRDSDEARAFRDWLRRADEISDDDLTKLVGSLSARMSRIVNAPSGRIMRVLLPTAALMGVDPTTATVAGTILSVLDQFIWDRILPRRGPWSLVAEEFPSLFRE